MAITRRGFLKLFGFGTVGLSVAPPIADRLPAGPVVAQAPPLPPAGVTSAPLMPSREWRLTMLVREVAHLLDRRLDRPFRQSKARRIGRGRMTHQFWVELPDDWDQAAALSFDAFSDRYLEPAAAALAQAVRQSGATAFGDLDLPTFGAASAKIRDTRSGVAVRGIMDYDVMVDRTRLRFDVLVGR